MSVLLVKEGFPEDVELLVTESQEELDDFDDISYYRRSPKISELRGFPFGDSLT